MRVVFVEFIQKIYNDRFYVEYASASQSRVQVPLENQ